MIREREWILTNRKGGYALGPANLINYRKYHGILIASDESFRRFHLVSSMEERIMHEGEEIYLDSNYYPDVIYPGGYKLILSFFLRPFPAFIYSKGGVFSLLKYIQMHAQENFSLIRYRNTGPRPLNLYLRPKFTLRDHHSLHLPGYWDSRNFAWGIEGNKAWVEHDGIKAFLFLSKGKIAFSPLIFRNVTYPREMMRGYDCVEDLLSPFLLESELLPGEELFVAFGDRDGDYEKMAEEAKKRYERFPFPAGHPLRDPSSEDRAAEGFSRKDYFKILEICMEDFVANDDLVAGFPWFSAWGRDTMISLPALEFIEGGEELIRRILRKYRKEMKDGMIPNFMEYGKSNYEALDPSLWFGLRVLEYLGAFERSERKEFLEAVAEIISSFIYNPLLPFHIDPEDGLIEIHPDTKLALTWMDAKVLGEPVTPRYGKPVEINALWITLLRSFLKEWKRDDALSKEIRRILRRAVNGMRKFWTEDGFADRIENGKPVMEHRPNYLIALSLLDRIFTNEQMERGYKMAKEKLLTPYGLRSLSPDHPSFRFLYMGDQRMRDLAYHQGTVWVWLILPMAMVALKIYRKNKNLLLRELEELVVKFRDEISEGKLASIPELYDGGEPAVPKGAPAQCWSVAAVLIIEKLIEKLQRKK